VEKNYDILLRYIKSVLDIILRCKQDNTNVLFKWNEKWKWKLTNSSLFHFFGIIS